MYSDVHEPTHEEILVAMLDRVESLQQEVRDLEKILEAIQKED